MRISRIKIQNFRNFANFEVNLTGNNIIIVGENNSGKTNLLYALRLLLDTNLPNSARFLEASDFWDGLERPFGGNEIRITVDFSDFNDKPLEQASIPHCFRQNGNEIIKSVSYIYHPKKGAFVSDITSLTIEDYEFGYYCNESINNPLVDTSFQRYIPLEVLPALRDAGNDLESNRKSPLQRLVKRLEIDEAGLKEYGKSIDSIINEILAIPSIANLQSRIDNRLNMMIGDHNKVDPRLGFIPTDVNRLLQFLRLFAEGEYKRRLNDIGTGYANILYIVLLLLDAQDKESASEQATMILAVEEPEAHLHPHLQRLVFGDLLNSNTIPEDNSNSRKPPVIITTHSPHIVSVTPLQDILMLKRSDSGTIGKNIINANLAEYEIKDIERYLDATRTELMFSKGVILVEGIVEQILITTYVRLFNTSLDKLGISIININGINFAPYVRLLGEHGFDIPIAIVTDGDPLHNEGSDSDPTNENNIPAGLKRGMSLAELLNPMQANLIDLNSPHGEIRELLAQVGIFVGNHTVEIDLLEAEYWDEYLATFRELGEGAQSIEKTEKVFQDWVNLLPNEKERKIVSKIKRVCGKGHFAQRISSKLATDRIPPYLRYALEFMGVI